MAPKVRTWNATFETQPVNSDLVGAGNESIQEVKSAIQERLVQEHSMNLADGPPQARHGFHKAGSAVAFVGSSQPTTLPDGVTALGANDAGRLWFNTTDSSFWEWSGAAWQLVKTVTNAITDLNVTTGKLADNAVTNTKIRDSGALSVIGRSANSSGDPADIAATAASGQVLRESGSVLGFGQIAEAGIANDAVTNTKLRNSAALSVIGNGSNASADPVDIVAGTDGHVLRRSSTTVGFGTIVTAGIADQAITNVKLLNKTSNISGDTGTGIVLGRATTGTTQPIEDLVLDNAVTLVSDSVVRIPTQHAVKKYVDDKSGSATTAYDLTINNAGAGTASPTTFNGSAARTLSYNSIGAEEGGIGTDVASATTTTIGGAGTGGTRTVTGTTTITSFGVSVTGTKRTIIFSGALTLTHNATSLILPGAANVVTVAGTVGMFVCTNGALGYWRCISIQHPSTPFAELTGRAPIASPSFTGTPSLPTGTTGITQTAGDSSTKLATTAFAGTAAANAASSAVTTHNNVTSPHSAVSTATASRLVVRDASGRAAFADPASTQDASNLKTTIVMPFSMMGLDTSRVVTYNTAGAKTWTKVGSAKWAVLVIFGGGGAGRSNSGSGGGGGGGGAMALVIFDITNEASLAFTVGAVATASSVYGLTLGAGVSGGSGLTGNAGGTVSGTLTKGILCFSAAGGAGGNSVSANNSGRGGLEGFTPEATTISAVKTLQSYGPWVSSLSYAGLTIRGGGGGNLSSSIPPNSGALGGGGGGGTDGAGAAGSIGSAMIYYGG